MAITSANHTFTLCGFNIYHYGNNISLHKNANDQVVLPSTTKSMAITSATLLSMTSIFTMCYQHPTHKGNDISPKQIGNKISPKQKW